MRAPRPAVGVWLITALWVAVAGGLWAFHDYQLKHGREIRLRAVPVDPRDPLRGDYVILRYEISAYELGQDPATRWTLGGNRTAFVTIEPVGDTGDRWSITRITPAPPEEGLYLRGRIRSASEHRIELVYGIESFFVPEGEGKRYEEAITRDRLRAVVSVSPHGTAYLKDLEIR